MTPSQARHLLALIADLYALASTPEQTERTDHVVTPEPTPFEAS